MTNASEVKEYLLRFGSFSRNAKLYLLAGALQGLGSGIWGVIFYLYLNLHEIGFQPDFIGNMSTASLIATGLAALPAGLLCEHIGTKRAIVIGQVSILATLAEIATLQPSILLFASLASGLIGIIGSVASAPFMMENSQSEERTYLFSAGWAIVIIMGVIGSLAGGVMPDIFNAALRLPTGPQTGSAVGYRITLAIVIGLYVVAVCPLLLIRQNKRSAQKQKIAALLSLQHIESPSIIVKFMIPTAIIGFGAGFIVPLFNVFFNRRFLATSEQVGVIFALGNVTLAVGTLAAPRLADKLGKVKSVVVCQFLSMPFIMLVTLAPNLALATGAYLMRGALMNMAGPISTTLQMEMVSENERATASGLMTMSDNIPRSITVSISGIMMTLKDFTTPFLFTTGTYFVASSLYFMFFRKAQKTKKHVA
jgi:MFS family permease